MNVFFRFSVLVTNQLGIFCGDLEVRVAKSSLDFFSHSQFPVILCGNSMQALSPPNINSCTYLSEFLFFEYSTPVGGIGPIGETPRKKLQSIPSKKNLNASKPPEHSSSGNVEIFSRNNRTKANRFPNVSQ